LKKINKFTISIIFFLFFLTENSKANFKEELLNKYKLINTLSFNFTQKIGDKVEFGNCYIKYPLLMKCEYPKKKKIIITNGKKLAIIKKRYKKIYTYPLKKTPLFYLLNKKNILNIIENHEPEIMDQNIIQYKITDDKSYAYVFFDKKKLEFIGWKTVDAYSNEVIFTIRNTKTNVEVENRIFEIPKEEDL
tara:strand:- start:525 stop:1097 length:573 start_codon:yes stop_codon:yes gene_type:complete